MPDQPTDLDLPRSRSGTSPTAPAAAAIPGRRGLDRRRILGAAVEFVDDQGLNALTMRRLGAHLGVEAMALYRYVDGREDLLDGVVEVVVNELYGDPDVYIEPRYGWADYLQRLAHGLRRIALAHPEVFPLIATRPPAAPWVRPPLRSLRWVESMLTALTSNGFTDAQAVAAYRAYSSFLLGHLLLEVAQHGVAITAADDPQESAAQPATSTGSPQDGGSRPTGTEARSGVASTGSSAAPSTSSAGDHGELAGYPTIVALRPLLSANEEVAEFEEALEALLDRLTTLLG